MPPRFNGLPISQNFITLGSYKIYKKIGHGGMSEVFSGTFVDKIKSRHSETILAIKVLKSEYLDIDEAIYSLQNEYWIGKNLFHDSLIRAHDLVVNENYIYLVMDYIDGQPIGRHIACKPTNPDMKFRIKTLVKLVNSLAYIHRNHVVHGDLKPSNVMICRDFSLKIIDFGLSLRPERNDILNFYAFSPKYASPERLLGGKPSFTDDIYALGCLSYIILTAQHPFGGKTSLEASEKKMCAEDIPGLDSRTKYVVQQMLSFDAINRPKTAQDVLNSLSHLL
jgi:non-specific serine/threonine protein kinase